MRIPVPTAAGSAAYLDLPHVHVLRHIAVPMLFGFGSHQGGHIVFDAADCSSTVGRSKTRILCPVNCGHLTLTAPPQAVVTAAPLSIFYTLSEITLVHQQFGHAAVDAVTNAFPAHTFTSADLALLKDIASSCVQCQTHSQLPRLTRYAHPQRPLAFNRVVAVDIFQISPALPNVLDITCLDTDFGQGRFVSSMRGEAYSTSPGWPLGAP